MPEDQSLFPRRDREELVTAGFVMYGAFVLGSCVCLWSCLARYSIELLARPRAFVYESNW